MVTNKQLSHVHAYPAFLVLRLEVLNFTVTCGEGEGGGEGGSNGHLV